MKIVYRKYINYPKATLAGALIPLAFFTLIIVAFNHPQTETILNNLFNVHETTIAGLSIYDLRSRFTVTLFTALCFSYLAISNLLLSISKQPVEIINLDFKATIKRIIAILFFQLSIILTGFFLSYQLPPRQLIALADLFSNISFISVLLFVLLGSRGPVKGHEIKKQPIGKIVKTSYFLALSATLLFLLLVLYLGIHHDLISYWSK